MSKKDKKIKDKDISVNTDENSAKEKKVSEKQKAETNTSDDTKETEKVEEKTVSELDILQEKFNSINDKYLRLSAEFDNYRKRTLKEKMELIKTGGEEVLLKVLPVMDNFERAIKSLDSASDKNAVKEGIDLIYNNFVDFLSQKGVKEIEAINKVFDTDLHEALTKIPAPSEDLKGKVIDVIEKGYTLYDKVIRYAKVVIGE